MSQEKTSKGTTAIIDILDRIEMCIQKKNEGCDLFRLKSDFVIHMTSAMGGKYSFTYGESLSKLFDIMTKGPTATTSEIISIIGSVVINYLINTAMTIVSGSGIPGIGEIDSGYIAVRQAITIYPILTRIKRILSINVMEVFVNPESYSKLHEYIKMAVDTMVDMKGLSKKMADRVKESSEKINTVLKQLYTEIKKYMQIHPPTPLTPSAPPLSPEDWENIRTNVNQLAIAQPISEEDWARVKNSMIPTVIGKPLRVVDLAAQIPEDDWDKLRIRMQLPTIIQPPGVTELASQIPENTWDNLRTRMHIPTVTQPPNVTDLASQIPETDWDTLRTRMKIQTGGMHTHRQNTRKRHIRNKRQKKEGIHITHPEKIGIHISNPIHRLGGMKRTNILSICIL